ncbi:MAG TPA: MarR family transcriptional regulator [Opitutaceae bacterium]|nr:MarR family transcriptional regulator [Opitutaceae bacterium]
MHLVLHVLSTAQALEKAGQRIFKPHGLTVAQFNVLNLLAARPEGMRASDLAKALVVDPSNITGLLKRLNRAGYLQELASPTDARQRIVALSGKGRRLWRQAHPAYERKLKEFEAKIAESDRRAVEKVLTLMDAEASSIP